MQSSLFCNWNTLATPHNWPTSIWCENKCDVYLHNNRLWLRFLCTPTERERDWWATSRQNIQLVVLQIFRARAYNMWLNWNYSIGTHTHTPNTIQTRLWPRIDLIEFALGFGMFVRLRNYPAALCRSRLCVVKIIGTAWTARFLERTNLMDNLWLFASVIYTMYVVWALICKYLL